jgi:hypothetical protein
LKRAYRSGARSISYEGKSVTCGSGDEMRALGPLKVIEDMPTCLDEQVGATIRDQAPSQNEGDPASQ